MWADIQKHRKVASMKMYRSFLQHWLTQALEGNFSMESHKNVIYCSLHKHLNLLFDFFKYLEISDHILLLHEYILISKVISFRNMQLN